MRMLEYECQGCGLCFELILGDADAPILRCPKCGGRVRRLDGQGDLPIFGTDGSGGTGPRAPRVTPRCSLESKGTEGLGLPKPWTVTPWGAKE